MTSLEYRLRSRIDRYQDEVEALHKRCAQLEQLVERHRGRAHDRGESRDMWRTRYFDLQTVYTRLAARKR